MLYAFTAPSGTGKTTIVHSVLKDNPEFIFSVSATTRPMRKNEVDGVDYFFLSVDEFEKKIAADEFVEYEKIKWLGFIKFKVGYVSSVDR